MHSSFWGQANLTEGLHILIEKQCRLLIHNACADVSRNHQLLVALKHKLLSIGHRSQLARRGRHLQRLGSLNGQGSHQGRALKFSSLYLSFSEIQ
jgi:hypothetical protein